MLCGYKAHAELRLLYQPRINLFVPISVTHEYHLKVLECLHPLQCISAHLRNTLPWGS